MSPHPSTSSAPEGGRNNPAHTTLIVYGLLQYPLRATIRDHLYSFRRHGSGRYFYLNIAARRPPSWLREVDFDTVIFHHTLTGQRMAPSLLRWQLRRARALDGLGRYRIAMVQDECVYTDAIDAFAGEFGIDHLFSVAPPSEWHKIYPRATAAGVRFSQNLTGYLAAETVERVDRIVAEAPSARSTSATGPGAGCSRSGATACCAANYRTRSARPPPRGACGPTSRPTSPTRSTATTGSASWPRAGT